MSEVYREFHLTDRNVAALGVALRGFWKSVVMPVLAGGRNVMVLITTEEAKRNAQQNKRLWGVVYKAIAEQAWVNGQRFEADVWHEHYARKFGVCEDITLPDGEIVVRRKSTTQMSIREFSVYMQQVEADAAAEFGVVIE